MAEHIIRTIRDCENMAIARETIEGGGHNLRIHSKETFPGVPRAVIVDGVRFEAVRS